MPQLRQAIAHMVKFSVLKGIAIVVRFLRDIEFQLESLQMGPSYVGAHTLKLVNVQFRQTHQPSKIGKKFLYKIVFDFLEFF